MTGPNPECLDQLALLEQRLNGISQRAHKLANIAQVLLVDMDDVKKDVQRLKADLSKPDGTP